MKKGSRFGGGFFSGAKSFLASNCRISAEAAFGDGSARENGRWGIGMQIIVPYWQKEYIHGMIEFVVVGIVSISA